MQTTFIIHLFSYKYELYLNEPDSYFNSQEWSVCKFSLHF